MFFRKTHAVLFIKGGNQISLITETPVKAKRGQNVTLKCSINQNVTVVNFSWTNGKETLCFYNNTIENMFNGISCSYTDDQSLLLNIQQVEPTHNGTYVCILAAKKGHVSIRTYLHVSGGNQISLITETSVMAVRGQNVTLKCSINQNVTVVNFSWSARNKTLCFYNNTIENMFNGISCSYTDDQSLLLNIQQVEPTHNGTYVCILEGSSGHVSIRTYLHVSGEAHDH
ncbi:uncharacterized protein zmp:0000000650 [Tachysurus ichikawai]